MLLHSIQRSRHSMNFFHERAQGAHSETQSKASTWAEGGGQNALVVGGGWGLVQGRPL